MEINGITIVLMQYMYIINYYYATWHASDSDFDKITRPIYLRNERLKIDTQNERPKMTLKQATAHFTDLVKYAKEINFIKV